MYKGNKVFGQLLNAENSPLTSYYTKDQLIYFKQILRFSALLHFYDRLLNLQEYEDSKTDPTDDDTDGEGLTDFEELAVYDCRIKQYQQNLRKCRLGLC